MCEYKTNDQNYNLLTNFDSHQCLLANNGIYDDTTESNDCDEILQVTG